MGKLTSRIGRRFPGPAAPTKAASVSPLQGSLASGAQRGRRRNRNLSAILPADCDRRRCPAPRQDDGYGDADTSGRSRTLGRRIPRAPRQIWISTLARSADAVTGERSGSAAGVTKMTISLSAAVTKSARPPPALVLPRNADYGMQPINRPPAGGFVAFTAASQKSPIFGLK